MKFHQGEEDKKDFTFDFSYWSFNSRDRHFATQERVILLESYNLLLYPTLPLNFMTRASALYNNNNTLPVGVLYAYSF